MEMPSLEEMVAESRKQILSVSVDVKVMLKCYEFDPPNPGQPLPAKRFDAAEARANAPASR